MPAANLEDKVVPPPSEHQGWVGNEFTVGFVGLYPLRKGLDKLAKATQMLRGRGLPIRLRVIGRCPSDIAAMDGVEFMGAIDKLTDVARFISVLRTVDLGCQLSRAELTGIAMMEFLRVGMPDVVEGGGGVLVPATITAEELAEELLGVMEDQIGYNALRQAAIRRSKWASWRRAAGEIGAVLAGIAS